LVEFDEGTKVKNIVYHEEENVAYIQVDPFTIWKVDLNTQEIEKELIKLETNKNTDVIRDFIIFKHEGINFLGVTF